MHNNSLLALVKLYVRMCVCRCVLICETYSVFHLLALKSYSYMQTYIHICAFTLKIYNDIFSLKIYTLYCSCCFLCLANTWHIYIYSYFAQLTGSFTCHSGMKCVEKHEKLEQAILLLSLNWNHANIVAKMHLPHTFL